jgi:hypothetical protein
MELRNDPSLLRMWKQLKKIAKENHHHLLSKVRELRSTRALQDHFLERIVVEEVDSLIRILSKKEALPDLKWETQVAMSLSRGSIPSTSKIPQRS